MNTTADHLTPEPPEGIDLAGEYVLGVLASVDRAAAERRIATDPSFTSEIVSIDLLGRTTLADRMFIASGRSSVHVGAIADRVIKACRAAGYPSPKVEGLPLGDWVLLDAQNAIVHIFRPDVRQFYNLEKMWSADRPGEAAKG